MKQLLIILTLIFCGCSTRKESGELSNADTTTIIESKNYIVTQTSCIQKNLSTQFDLEYEINRYSDTIDIHDSCTVKFLIKNKNTNLATDSIFMTSNFYYDFIFNNCDSVTSYTTMFNSDRLGGDNYYGDVVVADFNFDNKDDIALINDSGGNGGPLYSYYIQVNEKFVLDNFLTDSMTYFPTEINKSKRQLITYVHAGACCMGEHIYRLNSSTNKWKQISHKILQRE